jgi:hypothetical protein
VEKKEEEVEIGDGFVTDGCDMDGFVSSGGFVCLSLSPFFMQLVAIWENQERLPPAAWHRHIF